MSFGEVLCHCLLFGEVSLLMKCHSSRCFVVYYTVTGEVSLLMECHLVKCLSARCCAIVSCSVKCLVDEVLYRLLLR